jgi:hypothetical protein
MTREEAEALCAKYAAEHPDRTIAQWRPKEEAGGEWSVVRIDLPPTLETTTEIRADERPPTPPDPRPDVPPTVGPIA